MNEYAAQAKEFLKNCNATMKITKIGCEQNKKKIKRKEINNMKYKIELTCWDFDKSEPYKDEVDLTFDTKDAAMVALLRCVIDEADELNDPFLYVDNDCEEYTVNENRRYFQIDLEGGDGFDAVIRCFDGPEDYRNVTGYKIIKVKEGTK